jgi:hypothetical protein
MRTERKTDTNYSHVTNAMAAINVRILVMMLYPGVNEFNSNSSKNSF